MKKISLLSDTHSILDERFIPHLKNSDEIWHAGDIGSLDVYDKLTKLSNVKAVYGNIAVSYTHLTLPTNREV